MVEVFETVWRIQGRMQATEESLQQEEDRIENLGTIIVLLRDKARKLDPGDVKDLSMARTLALFFARISDFDLFERFFLRAATLSLGDSKMIYGTACVAAYASRGAKNDGERGVIRSILESSLYDRLTEAQILFIRGRFSIEGFNV